MSNIFKGAKETLSNLKSINKTIRDTKRMRKQLVKSQARKAFKKKTGRDFVPDPDAVFSIDRIRIKKLRKTASKALKKRGL